MNYEPLPSAENSSVSIMKTALILCAGNARRFSAAGGASLADRPKCLLPLSEETTILDGLIRPLQKRGYRIILGTGSGAESVEEHVQKYSDVQCVFNPEYATTNSIVTLWQLREFVDDETLLINGDTVIDETVFDLFTSEETPQLLVKRLPVFDSDTYRVVFDEERSVLRMGKEIEDGPSSRCAAFVGISRIGRSTLFLREIENLLDSGVRDTWPTTAYKNLIGEVVVRAHDIGSTFCFDVDTPEEFAAACAELKTHR